MGNIVIIGSEGTIGQAVRNTLKDHFQIRIDKSFKEEIFEGNQAIQLSYDITSETELDKVYEVIKEKNLSIDGVIYLAGVNYMRNFFTSTADSWQETFDINLFGIVKFLKRVYNLFSDKVSVVCVASQNGIVGHEDRVDYGPSKAAIIQLVKNLTVDFATYSNKDFKINCVSPTYVITEENKVYFESFPGVKLVNRIPYKKLVTPIEVANAIEFLMSEKSDGIRGQNIVIDYGYTVV
ncbi:SDR family oxidoreductase [Paucisalibacillus sp. EB02]|uniref:SDR family oxidoreductase n=1 Tax=Paucisalibacillus sp. EB02 TaxID=1347087 RepID=UPI0004B9BA3F|nr:SDR family oxidoreductase [Paucisalibacillus sp. EB02]